HFYRHILSDHRVLASDDHSLKMETSFICIRTMLDGRLHLLTAGKYVDHCVMQDGRCLLTSKTVYLDHSRIDTLIAIPLSSRYPAAKMSSTLSPSHRERLDSVSV